METAYRSNEHPQPGDVVPIHIKREAMEETRGRYERQMDMNMMQSCDQRMEPTHHRGPTSTAAMTMDYNPYNNPYDQRHFPQQFYPQQREEIGSPEKHSKEFDNYMPSRSPLQHDSELDTSETEKTDSSGAAAPVLKIKRSNGKLAIPDMDMLRGNGMQNLDLAALSTHQRAKREFVPEERKDQGYWTKRVKNNDSARRSRVKRKALEKIMETRLMELQQENIELRHEMNALKRRFGIVDEIVPAAQSYGNFKGSLESVLRDPTSSPGRLSKDDDLEQQSSASDDSRSLDDSRSSYNIRSASALSQSFDPGNRDRADSMGSDSSGSAAHRSPNSSSPPANWEYNNFGRTDKSGALDLTNDFSTRSTPTASRDYSPPVHAPSESDSLHYGGEKIEANNMRGFPLKCRWKLSTSSGKSSNDSSRSFPGM